MVFKLAGVYPGELFCHKVGGEEVRKAGGVEALKR